MARLLLVSAVTKQRVFPTEWEYLSTIKIKVHTHTRTLLLSPCEKEKQTKRDLYQGSADGVYGAVFYCVPGEQQGGAGAQWADEMNGQFSSLAVGESEASLNVFHRADILRPAPAGVHALAEHQLVPDVSAGLTSRGGGWLVLCGCRKNGHGQQHCAANLRDRPGSEQNAVTSG